MIGVALDSPNKRTDVHRDISNFLISRLFKGPLCEDGYSVAADFAESRVVPTLRSLD